MLNRKAGLLMLALAAMALGFVGCIDNDKSLVIMYNVVSDESCVYQADPEYIRTRGFLDLNHPYFGTPAARPIYYFFPQIHNFMPTNLSIPNNELDAMAIQLEKATISYEWLIGRESLEAQPNLSNLLLLEGSSFDIYLSGVLLAASSSGSPGKIVTHLRLIPPDMGTQLAALSTGAEDFVLGVHVTIKGTTLGGVGIESNEFVYPIEMCWGCLSYICPDGITYPSCQPGQDSNPLECPDEG